MIRKPDILTFSHLRWDFVYQRPQHLLSRFARGRRVIFIEEPVPDASRPAGWEKLTPQDNILVCRPHSPAPQQGFHESQIPLMRSLVRSLLENEQVREYVLWFYTPLALPLAEGLQPKTVVYDCMDELSAFLHAPTQLLEREAQLLQFADLVFTGGPSLYRAKKDRHASVHCFPSSVDAAHFGKARDGAIEAEEQARLPRPRLGYFGVIDERMDLGLLEALALAHPEWQISMVGPVVKIDPATLPRHANIHYFGQQAYADLPRFLAGWDVCLLPFARNQSTKFISPTKTLEYMAAEKMIVSTPITDVAEPYGSIVYLGSTAREFIAACEKAMSVADAERSTRVQGMRQVLSRTSWDSTHASMDALVDAAIAGQLLRGARTAGSPKTVVIGAGPTGLSAAYHLGKDSILVEQNPMVGGWCRSIEDKGFTFDYAGHIMFSNDPYVHQMYEMLLGDNVHWQDREAWIFSKGVYTRYPFQGSLYGLPPAVIKECVVGAIEARFGSMKANAKPAEGKTGANGAICATGDIKDCCADGILESTAKLGAPDGGSAAGGPRSFEEFIYKVWGAGIAKHFAVPYNKKLWAVPLAEMEISWLGGRVPMPDLEEMIEGALSPSPKPMGPNARFGYPLRGGFQALMNGFLPHLQGELLLNSRVVAVSPRRRTVRLQSGREIGYEHLINTMPLPVLVRLMGDEAPAAIRAAASALRHVSVRCVNIGVGREKLTDKHWIYYPEDTVFHRIFVQGNASPHCNAKGGFGLTCEITYSEYKPLPCDGDALIRRCIEDCHKVGFFRKDDPIWAANQVDLPYAYVVYDHGRKQRVDMIREWLEGLGILLAGRYSEWEYYNSDHAFTAGKQAAETVRRLEQAREMQTLMPAVWQATSESASGD
jgi:UDP-galactopyranose mutase